MGSQVFSWVLGGGGRWFGRLLVWPSGTGIYRWVWWTGGQPGGPGRGGTCCDAGAL